MKSADVSNLLDNLQPAINAIEDPTLKHLVSVLLNLIETFVSENTILRQENQALKDEINRLKGEQGKPDFKPNTCIITVRNMAPESRSAEKMSVFRQGHKMGHGPRIPWWVLLKHVRNLGWTRITLFMIAWIRPFNCRRLLNSLEIRQPPNQHQIIAVSKERLLKSAQPPENFWLST